MVDGPALYVGTLRHRRFTPRPHEFTYRLFMPLVDIDHVHEQMRVSPFTSVNRFNWAAFDDRDHFGDPSRPLRERVTEDARAQGIALPDGPIYLLTHLRYLGYTFNPISFYYCCTRDGEPETILAEVHNTFGDRRLYWLPASSARADGRSFRHQTDKTMHVSPFMPMDMRYEFVVTPPGPSLVAHMNLCRTADGFGRRTFDATLTLERRPWTARELHRALRRHPWMTAKVIGAIHWEAVRLWMKRAPYHANPGMPEARKNDDEAREAQV